jgi:hypothetical protein
VKLLRLASDGFGVLRGEVRFDPERVTVVLDDNERGKSTLLAALVAALYGLDGDRRSHRVLTPLERWRPWHGGGYGLELELECDGRRYTVARDFERGTVRVLDGDGQEVTPSFREGKDEFPVGYHLCGLEAEEFEKCAVVQQGELDTVVPADERIRRASTLAARLENAADTRLGDTNASEALQVLEGALRRYNAPELEFTGTVEHALQRLELKLGVLDADLKTLEHERDGAAAPLQSLVALAEEERAARAQLGSLDSGRRAGLAAEARRRLEADRAARAELDRLVAEAESLASAATLPPQAEAQFHEAVARHEEALRNLASLETRRREEIARERGAIEAELAPLAPHATGSAEDADRCVALAAEMRRIETDQRRLRDEVFTLREALAAGAHDRERLRSLSERFGAMEEADQRLLRRQGELALAYHEQVAALERRRLASTEVLRDLDRRRNRWRVPGAVLVALGVLALGAAAASGARAAGGAALVWLGGGLALLAIGAGLVVTGMRVGATWRAVAQRDLDEALRRLQALHTQRGDVEVALARVAHARGYRDQVELLRDWSEHQRLLEESAPALRAQEELAAVEQRRRAAWEEARALLERTGGGAPEPATLERVATAIRRAAALRQRAGELEQRWSWIDAEKRVAEAAAAGLKERGLRVLRSAGLTFDPDRSWTDHARDLAERARARERHAVLRQELIPRAAERLLPDAAVAELEAQIGMAAEAAAGSAEGPRPALEVERETERCHELLEDIQRRRGDLRLQIEEAWRRFQSQHPETLAQRERIDQALRRARRFQRAVELARDTIQQVASETHRRWADYLDRRVGELLGAFGGSIEQIRVGEDLDFSVRLAGGPTLPRGRADQQLSVGARDQLYLAVRLAISEFLSRGRTPLPLLLDDVFATSDDQRALGGVRLLTEVAARGHQVILLTCHRGRCDAILSQDPERARDWVRFVDLSAATVNTGPRST